jgi:hypothetical protein
MKFSYDDRDYVLDPDELTGAEAEMIEDAGGTQWETFGEWISRLYRGGWRPLKVALWVMMRRENPRLDYEELANVKIADVQIDLTEEDVRLRETTQASRLPSQRPPRSPTRLPIPICRSRIRKPRRATDLDRRTVRRRL